MTRKLFDVQFYFSWFLFGFSSEGHDQKPSVSPRDICWKTSPSPSNNLNFAILPKNIANSLSFAIYSINSKTNFEEYYQHSEVCNIFQRMTPKPFNSRYFSKNVTNQHSELRDLFKENLLSTFPTCLKEFYKECHKHNFAIFSKDLHLTHTLNFGECRQRSYLRDLFNKCYERS